MASPFIGHLLGWQSARYAFMSQASLSFEGRLLVSEVLSKEPLNNPAGKIRSYYGPHSEELDKWVKDKAARLGDFAEVTKKGRKNRPAWYCKKCEKAY